LLQTEAAKAEAENQETLAQLRYERIRLCRSLQKNEDKYNKTVRAMNYLSFILQSDIQV
jgi:hypothetical protein